MIHMIFLNVYSFLCLVPSSPERWHGGILQLLFELPSFPNLLNSCEFSMKNLLFQLLLSSIQDATDGTVSVPTNKSAYTKSREFQQTDIFFTWQIKIKHYRSKFVRQDRSVCSFNLRCGSFSFLTNLFQQNDASGKLRTSKVFVFENYSKQWKKERIKISSSFWWYFYTFFQAYCKQIYSREREMDRYQIQIEQYSSDSLF